MGNSTWGHKESDMMERLTLSVVNIERAQAFY